MKFAQRRLKLGDFFGDGARLPQQAANNSATPRSLVEFSTRAVLYLIGRKKDMETAIFCPFGDNLRADTLEGRRRVSVLVTGSFGSSPLRFRLVFWFFRRRVGTQSILNPQ
jgi:hypothetical protein